MIKKIKILFVIPSMNAGGAERITNYLLRNIDKNIFDIYLALVKKEGVFLSGLPKSITILNLKKERVLYSIFNLSILFKRLNPDIIYSTFGYMSLAIIIAQCLAYKKNRKTIVRESSIPRNNYDAFRLGFFSFILSKASIFRLYSYLFRTMYNSRIINRIICQSQIMGIQLVEKYKIKKDKIIIINNPVDQREIIEKAMQCNEYPVGMGKIRLISIGRLEYVKGMDLLIETIKKLNNEKYHLLIIGDGQEKEKLKNQIEELGISERVTLMGFQQNPFGYLYQSDLMVIGSRHDSFPNSLLESLALGKPVIAFNCPGGISEMIVPRENGELVEFGNIDALANKIHTWNREKYDSKKIMKKTNDKYGLRKIIKLYEEVFLDGRF